MGSPRFQAADGGGAFAADRLEETPGAFVKIPLVGSFEVHDSHDESIDAWKADGRRRFLVSDNMALFLSEGEVARPNAGLYLVPARTSPVFYMNTAVVDDNMTWMSSVTPKSMKGAADKKAHLKNAMNSVMFDVSCDIAKDDELRFWGAACN